MAASQPRRGKKPVEHPSRTTFRALLRSYGLMRRIMHPYFRQFGITGAQWGVLRALQNAEDESVHGLRQADIGDRLLIRPPSVSGVVDGLQRQGLVSRSSSRHDLRTKRVRLTTE